MDLRWDEIRSLELGPRTAAYSSIRVLPASGERLKGAIAQYGPVRTRLPTLTDGSSFLIIFPPHDAPDVLAACTGFMPSANAEVSV
jgi:hypothetical protein